MVAKGRHGVSIMSWKKNLVIGVVTLTWGLTAFAGPRELHGAQVKSKLRAQAVPSRPIRHDLKRPAEAPLEIARVSLGPPPPGENANSAVLKFEMSNRSSSTLTDIVFEASIVEEPQPERIDILSSVLAGPFVVRGKMVLDPGYTADCELLLRGVSPTCECAARVRVLSFRSIGASTPRMDGARHR